MQPSEAEISKRLRVLLAEQKISASELARRVGLKQSYVSRRMRGDVPWRTPDLALIAAELQVTVADLVSPEAPVGAA